MGAHLLDTHFTVANCAHIAVRTTLNANHAIRRVLKVFLFNTGQVKEPFLCFICEHQKSEIKLEMDGCFGDIS